MKNGVIPLNMVFNGTSGNIDLMTLTLSPMGGRDQADFDDHDDSEPDQIKTQSLDQEYEDRYGVDGAGEGNRTLI